MTELQTTPQRISHELLTHRLDCPYYHPEAIQLDYKLKEYPKVKKLSELVDPRRKITNGVRGPDLKPSNFRLVRLQDCKDWEIDFDGCQTISERQFKENKRCQLYEGDVVVAIGGYVGNASIVKNVKPAVIGQHSAVLPRNTKSFNERYLVAYLNSRWGAIQFQRFVSGTVQPGVNLEDLREIPIPVPDAKVQAYIGDKVRQAERLRERSRQLLNSATVLLDDLLNGRLKELDLVNPTFQKLSNVENRQKQQIDKRWIRRVPGEELELRIDCEFYNPAVKTEIEKVQKFNPNPLSRFVVKKVSEPPIHTDHYGKEGIHIISPANFSDYKIDLKDTNKLNPDHVHLFRDFLLHEGDLIFALVGDVGHACAVTQPVPEAITYRRTARLILKNINPFFVCAFLNNRAGDLQLKRMTTGVIQAQLRLEDSVEVLIPSFEPETQDWIGERVRLSVQMREQSENLTTAAKLIVEALIEGKLSEADLKAAQEDLEQDDTALDREILARLTRKGIDCPKKPPLFPDLDALYEALSDLEGAETPGDESANGNGRVSNVYPLPTKSLPLASETGSGAYDSTEEVPG